MSRKKRSGLGKGLSAILDVERAKIQIERSHAIHEIPIEAIESNPYQPRKDFDQTALEALAQSIKEHGLIQPITVKKIGENRYQLIAGERRLRAAQKAGVVTIAAYVREADNEDLLALALVENLQRSDLNPIEVALAYQRLMHECQWTEEQIARKVGKDSSTISNFLRLLKLPPVIQKALKERKLTAGHARALITIEDPAVQLQIFERMLKEQLSVRQVEDLVRKLKQKKKKEKKSLSNPVELHIRNVERTLEQHFSTKVTIRCNAKGKGEIRIAFLSIEDLNRLLELLSV